MTVLQTANLLASADVNFMAHMIFLTMQARFAGTWRAMRR
jgi:hypothetical protein